MNAFDKIIGYQSIKNELAILADMMRNSDKYTKLGVTMPRGVLLSGEPGVGKTLMANCLIEESGRKVFTLRKDKPDGDFIHAIQDTFAQAKKEQPSIVFLDDMDKYSDCQRLRSNAEEYVAVQSCMDDVADDDVFVIATVNNVFYLPDSLVREGRLGRKLTIKPPRGQDAVDIVGHFLLQKKCVAEVDAKAVAKILNGNSCAVLDAVINEAGIYTAMAGKELIDLDDMIRGILRVKFDAPESVDDTPPDVLLASAYHEAGHAVAAECLEPGSVCLVSILAHHGDIGGVTDYYQDERYWTDVDYMQNRVVALLAGKAATELVYGKTDVGAGNDISRASDIVGRIIGDYCSTSFDSIEREEQTGNGTRDRKEVRMAIELEKAYARAKRILAVNRAFLDVIAHALVEKKTLVASDVCRLKAGEELRS